MNTALIILSLSAALGLACAVALTLHGRGAWIGRRSCPPPPVDPYSRPFGDCSAVPMPEGVIIEGGISECGGKIITIDRMLTKAEADEIRKLWMKQW